jgi:hypothetical protein
MSESAAVNEVCRRSRAEADRLVMEFERSGMKRAAFCQAHGVAPQTLDYYRRLRRSKTEPTQRLVAVELVGTSGAGSWPAPSHQARLRVELRNGRQIVVEEGFSATLLKSVVAALEA